MIDQILKDGSFGESKYNVDRETFSQLRTEWDSIGKKFTPKVQAILLTDYAAGDRAWREITLEKCKTTESNHIYLSEDEERLSQVIISPEQALALLEKNHPENKKMIRIVLVVQMKQNRVDLSAGRLQILMMAQNRM